ncbi:MAG TPA: hypothetical protein VFT19_02135 [Solirubrobacterales bacterium]|nr:hypothetical protein [Solirubrobacterales bacterium]
MALPAFETLEQADPDQERCHQDDEHSGLGIPDQMPTAKQDRDRVASISLRDHPADIPIIAKIAPATTMPAAIDAAANSKSLAANPISARLTMSRRCQIRR